MATINPWINFNGNAEEAFTFYKSVFGGEFAKVVRFKDIASTEFPVPEKEENKIKKEESAAEWIKNISKIFYKSWKISKNWLIVVKNSLAKVLDSQLLKLLNSS